MKKPKKPKGTNAGKRLIRAAKQIAEAAKGDRDLDIVLSARLNTDLSVRFMAYAAKLGQPPSEALRILLNQHLPKQKRAK